jgi:hypothetical protein
LGSMMSKSQATRTEIRFGPLSKIVNGTGPHLA